MPIKSPKQFGMVGAIIHGTSNTAVGPSKEVAEEMMNKTSAIQKSKFARALAKRHKKKH